MDYLPFTYLPFTYLPDKPGRWLSVIRISEFTPHGRDFEFTDFSVASVIDTKRHATQARKTYHANVLISHAHSSEQRFWLKDSG
jgi:hypothetical protein